MTDRPFVVPGDHRPRDLCGRLVPHRLDAVTFMRAISGLREQFRVVVPDEYVESLEGPVTGVSVACTCGEACVIRDVARFVECPGSCGRWFLWTSKTVRVGRL